VDGAGVVSDLLPGVLDYLTDPATYEGRFALQRLLVEHLVYTVVSALVAAAIAVPLGLWVGHRRKGELLVTAIANTGRAVPDFGIIIVAFLIIGFSEAPVYIALVALAIPPILVNTYVGVQQVDPEVVDAARGMGLEGWQVLREVELPVAVPLIMAGVRTAAVQVVATATLAAYVGLGGVGRIIFDGFAAGVTRGARPGLPRVVVGSVIVALLAIATELLLSRLERRITPRGLRRAAEPASDDESGQVAASAPA
jgi:osmoprotectant transport system permease protein